MEAWIFGANPDEYEIQGQASKLKQDDWTVKRHRDRVLPGQNVVLWQSGPEAGIYALGSIVRKPYKEKSGLRVDIKYDELLKQPVFRHEMKKHPVLRNLSILKMPNGKNPFPVTDAEWQALRKIIDRDNVSIFTPYQQQEDQFTNGLVALMELSSKCDGPLSATSFVCELLDLKAAGEIGSCRVLRGFDGNADAEFCGPSSCIRLESKIRSGTLDEDQVQRHLRWLERSRQAHKALVLLTPDDASSGYIKRFLSNRYVRSFCSKAKSNKVVHLEWKRVYGYLEQFVANPNAEIFARLVSQFLEQIHARIFEEDFAGIIQKINFTKGEIDPRTFLDYLKQWRWWDTPRKYEKLDGTGRKLLLYDGRPDEKRIVAEVEIEKVERKRGGGSFPWRNLFAKTPTVFAQPISIERIRSIAGFGDFGRSGGKDMTPFRNITQEQYRLLTRQTAAPV